MSNYSTANVPVCHDLLYSKTKVAKLFINIPILFAQNLVDFSVHVDNVVVIVGGG